MINLKKKAISSPNIPFWKKVNYFFNSDIYLAENMSDYRVNAPLLQAHFAHIQIYNTKIERVKTKEGKIVPFYFKVYDYFGKDIMLWNKNNAILPSLDSYEDFEEEQNFKEGDDIYSLFFTYHVKGDIAGVIQARKSKFSNPSTKIKDVHKKQAFWESYPELVNSF